MQVHLLSTDAYRNQYQHCITPEINDIDTIAQLEDPYDRLVEILSISAQTTLPEREAREMDDIRHLAEDGKTKTGKIEY